MINYITIKSTTKEGIEKEINVYPSQKIEYFDVLKIEDNKDYFIKIDKLGQSEEIKYIEMTNETELTEEELSEIRKGFRYYLVAEAKKNNDISIIEPYELYIIERKFIENIKEIKLTETEAIIDEHIYLNKEEHINLIKYIDRFLENKKISSEREIEDLKKSKETILKKELEIINSYRTQEKLAFDLKKQEISNEVNTYKTELKKLEEILNETKEDCEEKIKKITLKSKEEIENQDRINKASISIYEEEIKNLKAKKSTFEKQLALILTGLIIGAGLTFVGLKNQEKINDTFNKAKTILVKKGDEYQITTQKELEKEKQQKTNELVKVLVQPQEDINTTKSIDNNTTK